jgi:DNA-binding transcriptional ArsR family regulator
VIGCAFAINGKVNSADADASGATPSPRRRRVCGETIALDMQPKGCIMELMDADMDKVFKALADPSRRQLLDRLYADNGQTLGQLCTHLDMTRQAVTKHLAVLEDANLVATIWRGREKLHFLNPVPIHDIAERWIGKFERERLRVLAELKKQLEGGPDG